MITEFTIESIKDNKQLVNFLGQQDRKLKKVVHSEGLYNLYDSADVMKMLRNNIDNCRSNVKKFIPMWESHIKYIEEMVI